jgi:hypothetical protein
MNLNAVIIIRYGEGLDDMLEVPYEPCDTFIDLGMNLKRAVALETQRIGQGIRIQAVVVNGDYLPITSIEDAHLFLTEMRQGGLMSLPKFFLSVRNTAVSMKEVIEMFHDSFHAVYEDDNQMFQDIMLYYYEGTPLELYPFIDRVKLLEYHRNHFLRIGNSYFNKKFLKTA